MFKIDLESIPQSNMVNQALPSSEESDEAPAISADQQREIFDTVEKTVPSI